MPGMRYYRARTALKLLIAKTLIQLFAVSFMLMTALPVMAVMQTYTVSKNQWLVIPVPLPEAKIGGGDFYNLQLGIAADHNGVEYMVASGGVRFRSESMGRYQLELRINHISKSSCAGVEVTQYQNYLVEVNVMD